MQRPAPRPQRGQERVRSQHRSQACNSAPSRGPWQAPVPGCPLTSKGRRPWRAEVLWPCWEGPFPVGPGLPRALTAPAACSGRCQSTSMPPTTAVRWAESRGGGPLPSWLCPQPHCSGGWAHGPHSCPRPPCPALAHRKINMANKAGHAWGWGGPIDTLESPQGAQPTETASSLSRPGGWVRGWEPCQGPECHLWTTALAAQGPGGGRVDGGQPGEVRGRPPFLRQPASWISGAITQHCVAHPAPSPARPTQPCCCCRPHRPAPAPHFCLLGPPPVPCPP